MYKLTEHEKDNIKGRLINYVRGHQVWHELSHKDMAEIFEITEDEYREGLDGKDLYEPIADAIETMTWLTRIRKDQKQDPGNLLSHLANNRDLETKLDPSREWSHKKSDEDERRKEREIAVTKLYDWEQDLLKAFRVQSIPDRRTFFEMLRDDIRHGYPILRRWIARTIHEEGYTNKDRVNDYEAEPGDFNCKSIAKEAEDKLMAMLTALEEKDQEKFESCFIEGQEFSDVLPDGQRLSSLDAIFKRQETFFANEQTSFSFDRNWIDVVNMAPSGMLFRVKARVVLEDGDLFENYLGILLSKLRSEWVIRDIQNTKTTS